MSLLNSEIADAIYAGFKGKLLTGVLRKITIADSTALNDLGDAIDGVPVDYACEGFVSRYSAFYRQQAGIPESDLKASFFAKSLPAGIVPGKDDKVKIGSVWYQIRKVAIDPAGALWICQSFEITDQGEI